MCVIDALMPAVFILSTSENFPDIMLPAYHCNRLNAVLFIVFFVIGVYFILNLVLAVAFSEFLEITKEKVRKRGCPGCGDFRVDSRC